MVISGTVTLGGHNVPNACHAGHALGQQFIADIVEVMIHLDCRGFMMMRLWRYVAMWKELRRTVVRVDETDQIDHPSLTLCGPATIILSILCEQWEIRC